MRGSRDASADVDREALRRARLESDRLAARVASLGINPGPPVQRSTGLPTLVALAYPDRVARRRPGGGPRARFVLRNGRGAELRDGDPLAASPFIVAAQLDDRKPEAQVFLAAAIDEDDVRLLFADQIASGSPWFDDATGTSRWRTNDSARPVARVPIAAPSEESSVALLHAIRRRSSPAAVGGRCEANT
jgi:ATP-dependent helicase HrpB